MRKSRFKVKKQYYFVALITTICFCLAALWYYNKTKFIGLKQNPTILMVFNGEYDSEAENALAALKQNTPELIKDVTICVSDERSKDFAKKHNLKSFELTTINATGTYLSVPMNIMGRRKIECILHVLKENKDVLYMDTDIVFLSNPIPEFNANYDINIQADECSRPYSYAYLCTGFMYIKPTSRSISFLEQIIAEVVKNKYKINDQNALDFLVRRHGLLKLTNLTNISINVLDVCKFPNGCRYFDQTDKFCSKQDSLIVHNNHIIGIANKRNRFEQHGLIFSNS